MHADRDSPDILSECWQSTMIKLSFSSVMMYEKLKACSKLYNDVNEWDLHEHDQNQKCPVMLVMTHDGQDDENQNVSTVEAIETSICVEDPFACVIKYASSYFLKSGRKHSLRVLILAQF
eukprot:5328581-Amphidinium_carterae.4